MAEHFIQISFLDLIGVMGVACYAGNYLLVSLGRGNSDSIAFYVRSGLGAIFLLISLTEDFNIASAMIQVLFIAISVVGIATRLRRPKPIAPFIEG